MQVVISTISLLGWSCENEDGEQVLPEHWTAPEMHERSKSITRRVFVNSDYSPRILNVEATGRGEKTRIDAVACGRSFVFANAAHGGA
jgi:hypothetical protein